MTLTIRPGRNLGEDLGKSLQSGLETLVKAKLDQRAERDKMAQLQSILGGGQPQQQQPLAEEGEEVATQGAAPQEPREITDEQILAVSQLDPNLGRLMQAQKDSQAKQAEWKAKREFQRAAPILARADERAEEMINKENSLDLMALAVKEGNLGMFSPDSLADITGIEGFRTGKGALFISAGKEYFLGSIKRAGARPNVFIEKQIQKMLPKIGRSRIANLTVLDALKSELNIDKEYQDILNRLAEEDKQKYGGIQGDIGNRANKELRIFANEEQKRLEISLRNLEGRFKGKVQMRDPGGTIRLVPSKEANAAKKAGYKVVK